jgi:hypothetical protein
MNSGSRQHPNAVPQLAADGSAAIAPASAILHLG